MVQATHGVITNIRPDHLDVMGPTVEDVGWALGGSVPSGTKLFTSELHHRSILEAVAKDRKTAFHPIAPEGITDAEMQRFSYHEHLENVALALAVCADLGVDRDTALRGMWAAKPDPGAMTEHTMEFFGRKMTFVNGFAANDPVSTEQVWRMALNRHPELAQKIAVFNCRADRADRSVQLARAFVRWPPPDALLLMGPGAYIFAREAVAAGMDPTRVTLAEQRHVADVFEVLVGMVERPALVMGMGNIGDLGLGLASYFANRSQT